MNEHDDPARILVADDDRNIADLVRMYLARPATTSPSPATATRRSACCGSSPFDLAILDIMMPGPDGLQIIRTCASAARCR